MNYYLLVNNQSVGPMTKEQLFSYNINDNSMISVDGGEWKPLYSYPDLMQFYRLQGGNPSANQVSSDVTTKKYIAGICAILFGYLGVQYFICGKIAGGFITILLNMVTCGLWDILCFVQGIMMMCMSDSDFKAKYLDSQKVLPLF